jgi:hypothetical protein
MFAYDYKKLLWNTVLVLVVAATAFGQTTTKRVIQSREVVDAYRVCTRFENILSEDLDFARAFEATFAADEARRREIAIAEGEFDRDTVASVDTPTLVDAFKSRMQIAMLMLALIALEDVHKDTMFPPKVGEILDRKPPETAKEFPAYAQQLKSDAAEFRAHIGRLAQQYPALATAVRDFKTSLAKRMEVPTNYIVKPMTLYSKGRVLGPQEEYYQIGSYAVVREGAEMKIIGIRFFTLF